MSSSTSAAFADPAIDEALQRFMLPAFWSGFKDEAPFVHPQDRPVIAKSPHGGWLATAAAENFDTVVQTDSLGVGDDRFYFSLLPVPYAGDLARADIFILLLNPGGGGVFDFHVEYRCPSWRDRVLGNLSQAVHGMEFPNLNLDPEFCWTGGYQWWERKLRAVAMELVPLCGSYRNALRELSRRVACIELVPYHSSSFGGHKLLEVLPSTLQARRYVREVLLPRAQRDELSIIVTRQSKIWGLPAQEGVPSVVHYTGQQARGVHFGPNTTGGREILRRIRKTGPLS